LSRCCRVCVTDDVPLHAREPSARGVGAALDASAQRTCRLGGPCRGSQVQLRHIRRAGRVHHDNVQRVGCLVLLQGRELSISSSQSAAWQIGCDISPQRLINMLWGALQVFVISASKIREQNYETLYSLMTKNRNGMVAKIVFSVPKPFQVGRCYLSPVCHQFVCQHALLCLTLTVHGFLVRSRSCTCCSTSCCLPPPRPRPTCAGIASSTTPPSSCSCFWALHGMVRFANVSAMMTAKSAGYTFVAYNGCRMMLRACRLSACVAWYREQLLLPALCIQIREEDWA
jgi:hypothetical protein